MVTRKKRLRRRRERRARATRSLPPSMRAQALSGQEETQVATQLERPDRGFRPERSGVILTADREAQELWCGDNVNRSEKAAILSEPRAGVRKARWRAYVARARAKDAELDGDWAEMAAAIADAWEWEAVAQTWEQIEAMPEAAQ